MSNSVLSQKIIVLKQQLGRRVTIMGHHYQNQLVINHTDLQGDSLELARKVATIESDYIVFCGVFFMAESAALLARPNQKVCTPTPDADCSMALMAPAQRLRNILQVIESSGKKVIPLTYVNSSLDVKAVVGEAGGAVCTSANADIMLTWALKQRDTVLFLPDKCLGANTAKRLGLAAEDVYEMDIRNNGARMDAAKVQKAKLLLWPGQCCIHTRFTVEHVAKARKQYPNAKIVVHPESTPEVVGASDAAGSTSFIIKYVEQAEKGSTIIIGTELNLVARLAHMHKDRVTVVPLLPSECSSMALTTEINLLAVLESIACNNPINVVTPEPALFAPAKLALERMLNECAKNSV